jgi:hypothetical protein
MPHMPSNYIRNYTKVYKENEKGIQGMLFYWKKKNWMKYFFVHHEGWMIIFLFIILKVCNTKKLLFWGEKNYINKTYDFNIDWH